ncbi:MAG: LemA family protein [Lachnospiraceae bacterium]|nr:LemA family protein [Lachnospiraceae bacterium]
MPILIGVLVVVFIIAIWYVSTYNGIKALGIKVDEGLSGIDVALTKRYDTLTKLLDVVKGYQKHEKEILLEVIKLRSGMSMAERNAANTQMDQAAKQINVLAEAYPELKSSNNFIQLQNSIADVEEHLQAARRLYNSNVSAYNTKIVMFPNTIVANAMGAKEKEFFEAEEAKRSDVQMSF